MGSIECNLVLGGAAYLAQHFTKNRTADIFIGLFVANILFGCGRLREGFKEGNTNNEKKKKLIAEAAKKRREQMAVSEGKPDKVELEEVEEDVEVKTPRVDYAATMEIAYDNLNKMLGEGGMKNLTKDTKGLMEQQKDLMKQLKDFAPLMEQAGNMLDKLGGMDNLKGLMGKVGGIGLANGKKK